jgi:hypothetical protein
MRRNYGDSSKGSGLRAACKSARQGDFFLARYAVGLNTTRDSPVLVVGNDGDRLDVIVCSCSTRHPRAPFDVAVRLLKETVVRTNKVHTIARTQLMFPIPQRAESGELARIISLLKLVFGC